MKQIPIKCKGNRNLSYKELKTFQGNLKEMSKSNAEKLKKSILKYGWIAPIFVWNKDYILDGHGRLLILGELFKIGYQIDNLPIVDIEAKTKKEAAEILLAINSKYQNITEEGLYQFVNEMELDLTDIKIFELPAIDMERFEMGYFADLTKKEDINIEYKPKYEVAIECKNESEQKKVYDMMNKKGYICRILIL